MTELVLTIDGHHLPGRSCGGHQAVKVGLQIGREPAELVDADAPAARWQVRIRVENGDFKGPAVHGRRGERFVYLTWLAGDEMFRRAKLMLADVPENDGEVTAHVHLTDDCGLPRCARLNPPALTWS